MKEKKRLSPSFFICQRKTEILPAGNTAKFTPKFDVYELSLPGNCELIT